jgi:carbamoyltransferase
MYVLGIHIGHDANACLVCDGQVIADVQEERFSRIKHQHGIPFNAIAYCLRTGGIGMEGVDAVAFSGRDSGQVHAQVFGIEVPPKRKTLRTWLREMEDELRGIERPGQNIPVYWSRFLVPRSAQVFFVEHHLAHAASAYYTSGCTGRALIATADGVGDGISLALWRGENADIQPLVQYGPEGSLGWFYSNITEALGWWHGDGEGKTMGLAPYGDYRSCEGVLAPYHPHYDKGQLYKPHRYGPVSIWSQSGAYQWHLDEANEIKVLVEQHSPEHIAAEAQRVLEKQMFNAVLPWLQKENTRTLCCAGGVFLNVKMNQRFWYSGTVEQHHVFPNCGDGGLALGAALYAYYQMCPSAPIGSLEHVMWGPEFSAEQIEKQLGDRLLRYRRVDNVTAYVAQALADGKIVGWFQGPMEGGPRALGGRSILMSAAKLENKDIINAKVKFREPFRPFCPSLVSEAASDYLIKSRPEPYMITSFDVQPDKRDRIPAVVHVDGTLRPQTVHRKTHPLYWQMIHEFGELTGDPLVLNTSFNIKGEPIVCSPSDAIRCFYGSGIDVLAIGSFVLEK